MIGGEPSIVNAILALFVGEEILNGKEARASDGEKLRSATIIVGVETVVVVSVSVATLESFMPGTAA
jgi:hypothetical protein